MASRINHDSFGDNLLTCSICYERFKNPKVLPCLHSFCLNCVTKHNEIYRFCNAGKLSCPTCRALIPLPETGLAGFRNDGVATRVKQLLKSLPYIEVINNNEPLKGLVDTPRPEVGDEDLDDVAAGCNRKYAKLSETVPLTCDNGVEGAVALPREMIQDNPDPPIVTKKRSTLQKEQNKLQSAIAQMRNKMLELYYIECYVQKQMDKELQNKMEQLNKMSMRDLKKARAAICEKHANVLKVLASEQDLLYNKIVQSKAIHDVTEEVLELASSPQVMEVYDFLMEELGKQDHLFEEEKPQPRVDLLHGLPLPQDLIRSARQEMEATRLLSLDNLVPSSRDPRKMGIQLVYKISGYGKEPGKFNFPTHATFMPSGNLLVSDKNNYRLQVFDSKGKIKGELFQGIVKPRRARINPVDGTICVSDEDSESIKIFNTDGDLVGRVGDHFFMCVAGLDFDSKGNMVVTDPEKCHVSVHEIGLASALRSFLFRHLIDRKLPHPYYVCVNDDDQFIVSDARNNRVKVFSSSGRLLFHIDNLACPRGVTVDPYGNILIAEGDGHCVSMYSPHGKFLQYLINSREFGLCYPLSLDMDKNGRLAVTQCGFTSPHEVMVFQIG